MHLKGAVLTGHAGWNTVGGNGHRLRAADINLSVERGRNGTSGPTNANVLRLVRAGPARDSEFHPERGPDSRRGFSPVRRRGIGEDVTLMQTADIPSVARRVHVNNEDNSVTRVPTDVFDFSWLDETTGWRDEADVSWAEDGWRTDEEVAGTRQQRGGGSRDRLAQLPRERSAYANQTEGEWDLRSPRNPGEGREPGPRRLPGRRDDAERFNGQLTSGPGHDSSRTTADLTWGDAVASNDLRSSFESEQRLHPAGRRGPRLASHGTASPLPREEPRQTDQVEQVHQRLEGNASSREQRSNRGRFPRSSSSSSSGDGRFVSQGRSSSVTVDRDSSSRGSSQKRGSRSDNPTGERRERRLSSSVPGTDGEDREIKEDSVPGRYLSTSAGQSGRRLGLTLPATSDPGHMLSRQRRVHDSEAGARQAVSGAVDAGVSSPAVEEVKAAARRPRAQLSVGPQCYACGAVLQCTEADAPGYLPPPKYEQKKRHRQLATQACTRCQQLAHGKLIAAVGGHGGYRIKTEGPVAAQFTAEALREQLMHLRTSRALVLKLVDVLDFNGSFLSRIRDIVGGNPIILVVTKVDLLPEGTSLDAVGDWIREAVARKKLNVVAIHLTSSKAHHGFEAIAATIHRERQGRDVYVIGAANVGKSAFISALLDEMASRDPNAAAARRRKPMASAVPGTTLGPIRLRAFSSGGDLLDTPGVHLHHRMAAFLSPPDLCALSFKRRLRGFVTEVGPTLEGGAGASSLFWGGIVRIDVLQAPPGTSLVFYGPTDIRVHRVPTPEADAFYVAELGQVLNPPSGPYSGTGVWEGLPVQHPVVIPLPADNGGRGGPVADLVVSGLGWVAITCTGEGQHAETNGSRDDTSDDDMVGDLGAPSSTRASAQRRTSQLASTPSLTDRGEEGGGMAATPRAGSGAVGGVIRLLVRTPKGVELFLRDPLPVGWAAQEWYEFADLDEVEERARPPLVFEAKPV